MTSAKAGCNQKFSPREGGLAQSPEALRRGVAITATYPELEDSTTYGNSVIIHKKMRRVPM